MKDKEKTALKRMNEILTIEEMANHICRIECGGEYICNRKCSEFCPRSYGGVMKRLKKALEE